MPKRWAVEQVLAKTLIKNFKTKLSAEFCRENQIVRSPESLSYRLRCVAQIANRTTSFKNLDEEAYSNTLNGDRKPIKHFENFENPDEQNDYEIKLQIAGCPDDEYDFD